MTLSPAFAGEMDEQMRRAQAELADALTGGDDVDVAYARLRLADLEALYAQAADDSLVVRLR